MNFVDQRTLRWPPFHSTAFNLILATSWSNSWRNFEISELGSCKATESDAADRAWFSGGNIIKKDNSVSISADRELRFVDPNRVKIGEVESLGESHKPDYQVRSRCFGCLWASPFAWYVQPGFSHSFSSIPWPLPSSEETVQDLPASFTAPINRCSNRVYASGILPDIPFEP